jgi:DNA primase
MAASMSLDVDGRQVSITHPDKIVFPDIEVTKLDGIQYY